MLGKFSVKKPYTVLVGVILVIVLGVVSFSKMTTDLMPNISLPYVIVMTTYAGASPETVETVVTRPVEATMATVSNIESISSVSSENYSMVILEFAQSTDMNSVSLEIRESLDQIKSYWDDSVGNPIIMKLNPDMLPVMIAAVGMEGMEPVEISAHITDFIVPQIESIEGVASVSATGLLEESVNVIIQQDKIDEVNKLVFAAIDDKMAEAEKELNDGKQTLLESQDKITDGKKEVWDGQKKLSEGKNELEDGKKKLTEEQEKTKTKLAETKRDLLTAKMNLEAAKINFNTNIATAIGLNSGIVEIDFILESPSVYQNACNGIITSVSNSDAGNQEQYKQQITTLKKKLFESTILKEATNLSPDLKTQLNALNALNWTDPDNFETVYSQLNLIVESAAIPLTIQKVKMASALNDTTSGLGYEAYVKMANETIVTLDDKLGSVNYGLVELEKGNLTAAIEFANANSAITLGEYQMDMTQAQLDAIKEQLEAGEEQLTDAREQMEDGEAQFAEAKESAYESADMTDILTVDTVKALLMAQNFSMPAGYVTEEGIDYLVRIGEKPTTVDELKEIPLMDLHMEGVPVITLADVADVFYTDNSSDIYANVNGSAGVMLTIQKQTGYSTGEVSDILSDKFNTLMEEDSNLEMIKLMDQGIYIDLVMDNILNNILFGGFLAILILIIFLKDIRPTLVIACSIPISVITAVVCMYFSGVTLNVISLSGLALGIGMLVDNSIVVIENIYRLRGEGYSIKEASIVGAKEVAGAIGASTLTTICVFLPIVFTEGITRQLFVDMGLTIAYSLLASLLIALTVVPAMASKVLGTSKEQKDSKFFSAMIQFYSRILDACLNHKKIILSVVTILFVVSIFAGLSNGTAFMADMDSTQMTVNVALDKGAPLEETAQVTDSVVEAIMEIDEVKDVGAMSSGSNMSMLMGGGGNTSTNIASVYVLIDEQKKRSNDEIADMIIEKTADFEAEITVDTSSMDMTALGGSGISIQVRGRDLDTLQAIATDISTIVESVEGTADVSDGLEETNEELRIIVDYGKAMEYGLTVAQVFTQITPKLADASNATTLVGEEKDYNVYIINGSDAQLTRKLVEGIEIEGTDEEGKSIKIPLKGLATFESASSLSSINRADQTRYIGVSASIAEGYNVGKVSTAVEDKLVGYSLPEGYQLVFSGQNEMINEALEQVLLMLVLALIFMYLIMVAQFQSLLSPFIIMFTIPLAFTGGFAGLFISGSEVSVIAMIGFVMLSGIIVNNGIVLIDYMNQLRENGMEKRSAILEAGRTRLRPVLMTALTTILALSTMVFSNDMGSEMAKPMAIVTIGGLLYGTLLTLIVIPCIYEIFIGNKK